MNLALVSLSTYASNFSQILSKLAESQRKPIANNANQNLAMKPSVDVDVNSKSAQLTKKSITADFAAKVKKSTIQNTLTSSKAAPPACSQKKRIQIEEDYEPLLHYLPENNS